MTERHVKRFVFGKLLPIRGVENVWERRYGWHWIVQQYVGIDFYSAWEGKEWLNKRAYKDGGVILVESRQFDFDK